MPISREDFEEQGTDATVVRKQIWKPKITEFLTENSGDAYPAKEIADALEAVPATVNQTLKKLIAEDKVIKKSVDNKYYYMWNPDFVEEDDEEDEE